MKLRSYQSKAVGEILIALDSHQGVFMQAPCGCGKTVIFSEVIRHYKDKDHSFKAVVIAHRKELVDQASVKLAYFGIEHGIVGTKKNPSATIQVATIQTLVRRGLGFEPDLIVIDEAHLAAANSYQEIIKQYPRAKRLLVSATPKRLDGKGFDDVASRLISVAKVRDLIDQGFLVEPSHRFPVQVPDIDLSGIKTVAGDYSVNQLEALLNQRVKRQEIVNLWHRDAYGKRTIGFCVSVDHCHALKADFESRGERAEVITSQTPDKERKALLEEFREGKLKILLNVNIFSEGLDVPNLEAVILARPTQSVTTYVQQVGRVMRPSPGKTEAIVLDCVWNTRKHGPIDSDRTWTLEGIKKVKINVHQLRERLNPEVLKRAGDEFWDKFNGLKGKYSRSKGKPYTNFDRAAIALAHTRKEGIADVFLIAALGQVPTPLKDEYETV